MNRVRSGGIAATVVAGGALALAAGALAAGTTHYEGGSKAHPPYVYIAVSNGKVVSALWKITESCSDGRTHNIGGNFVVQATIDRHGHFARTLFSSGSRTTFSGNLSGKSPNVKVQDSGPTSLGTCHGAHTFSVGKTSSFH